MTLFKELRDRIEFELIQAKLPIEEQASKAKDILKEIVADAVKNKQLKDDDVDISQLQFDFSVSEESGQPYFFASNDHTRESIKKLKDKEKIPKDE